MVYLLGLQGEAEGELEQLLWLNGVGVSENSKICLALLDRIIT